MRIILTWLSTVLLAILLVDCSSDSQSERDTSNASGELEACMAQWNPASWQQGSGANEWWIEYSIGGATVSSAHLEIVATGATVPLALEWSKWRGPTARIAKGTQVVVHAQTAAGLQAQTKPFGYLVVTAPVSDPCVGVPVDGGTVDGGACSSSWTPSWSQGSGANEWWVEYAVGGGPAAQVSLEIVGGRTVTLAQSSSKWVGPAGSRIARGTQVVVRATNAVGQSGVTTPFGYLDETRPVSRPCTPGGSDSGSDAGPIGTITPADVYDPAKVLVYELGFDDAALATLSSTSTDEDDMKAWVHASFRCGSTSFQDVGVRRKGQSTFRALPRKAAFKIRFDRYVPGQTFAGFRDLTLNNSVSDPTFLAERLSYHVFRSVGLPAPRTASAQLTINGAPWGLYVNVETPNKQLNDRLFGARAGTLYEVNYGSQWLPRRRGRLRGGGRRRQPRRRDRALRSGRGGTRCNAPRGRV